MKSKSLLHISLLFLVITGFSFNLGASENTGSQAKDLIVEFLDLSKRPQKNFEQYITALMTILDKDPSYKDLNAKLEKIKTLNSPASVSKELLVIKNKLPQDLSELLSKHGARQLMDVLRARLAATGEKAAKINDKVDMAQAIKLLNEFLDVQKYPKKNFEEYIDELIVMLKCESQYDAICTKLKEIKKIKNHLNVSRELLGLKSKLPPAISGILSQKKPAELLKVLKARVR